MRNAVIKILESPSIKIIRPKVIYIPKDGDIVTILPALLTRGLSGHV